MELRRLVLLAVYIGEAVGVLALGLSLVALGGYVLSRIARRWGTDLVAIGTPVPKFQGLDEGLRKRTEVRRAQADAIKREGRQIESGDGPVIRLVKGVR